MGILRRIFSPVQSSTEPLSFSGRSSGDSLVSAPRFRISAYDVIRFLLASALLLAAGLTCHQLVVEPAPTADFWTSRPFLAGTVLVNLIFGLWLLSGLFPHQTRVAAGIWFGILGIWSLIGAVSGRESCACFGAAKIPPGPVSLFDGACVLALWICCERASIRAPACMKFRVTAFMTVAVTAGIGATLAIASYAPAAERAFVVAPRVYDETNHAAVAYELRIVNTTDKIVRFDDKIASSCGCTTTKLGQQVLDPGASTALHVHIDHRGIVGMRTVFLTLTDDTNRRWQYTVKAPAYPRIQFERADVNAGDVLPGASHHRTVVVHTYAIGDTPPIPGVVHVDSPHVSASLGASRVEAIDKSVTRRASNVHLAITPPLAVARHVTQITVACHGSDARTTATAKLRLDWSVRSDFRVSPERVFLGEPRAKEPHSRQTVIVETKSGASFRVKNVAARDGAVRCQARPANNNRVWEITIEVNSSAAHGPMWTEIVVETDSEETPTIVIPVAFAGGNA